MRLESALEIVGALKRRFGEPLTVTEVCRDVALSYQPVYALVQELAARGAVSVRRAGRRALCEPAATSSGSLWLAHWSVEELRRARASALGEPIRALEGRISAAAPDAGVLAALDPGAGRDRAVYVTDADLGEALDGLGARVVPAAEWAGWLAGPQGDWAVVRRVLPLCGQQRLWEIALAARDRPRARPAPPSPSAPARRRDFVD